MENDLGAAVIDGLDKIPHTSSIWQIQYLLELGEGHPEDKAELEDVVEC